VWEEDAGKLALVVLRTAAVYGLLLVGLRLTGKRQAGQITPFDLVLLLLLSNAVQNAMLGNDTTVLGGAVAVLTLLAVNFLVNQVRVRSKAVRTVVEGVPVILVEDGEVRDRNLRQEGMTMDDLWEVLREHEVNDLHQVRLAMLEVDGNVSVIQSDSGGLTRSVAQRTSRRR
jgi:uncharacterized membrane protein YcaP (DUF421 family)